MVSRERRAVRKAGQAVRCTMRVLIGNTVKTQFADYPCATREEAEALFMTLRDREEHRDQSRWAGPGEAYPALVPGGARPRKE